MENKYLIIVDMQKDFVMGALGSAEARAIVSAVVEKLDSFDGTILFTKDTHHADYLTTQEGKNLPVEHCIEGSEGWELIPELQRLADARGTGSVYKKETFGSLALAESLREENEKQPISSIELIGVCTDICVVSNALLIKAYLPEVPVMVDAACCAGVTPEKHEAALETMRSCQITVY